MTTYLSREVAAKSLQVAQGYADAPVKEEGGNNRGDYPEFFQSVTGGHAGDPWCADFVSTCRVKAYCQLSGLLETRSALRTYALAHAKGLLLSGYCPSLWQMCKDAGLTHDKHFDAQPGDLVFYDFNGQGEPHHVGLVRFVHGDGTVHTIEGNTGDGSAADGDGVYLRTRPLDHVFGFAHFA